jgi:transposase
MPAYSLDLRTRVVAAYRQPGARQAAVAERFGVSVSFLKKLLRHERQTGCLAAKAASGGRVRYLDAEAQAWLVAYVGQHPDVTLAELGQAWQAQGGRPVGQTCLWQVLKEHDLRRKKKPARQRA